VTGSPTRASRPAGLTAEELLTRARAAGDTGHPATAAKLCHRALRVLDPAGAGSGELRRRVLTTLAYSLVEQGDTDGALEVIDSSSSDGVLAPTLLATKGIVMVRSGRTAEAMAYLDQAVAAFRPEEARELATVLLNRGFQHMQLGDLRAARRDTAEAERLGASTGDDVMIFMARYNLGYITFLGGDLPGALDAMAAAERLAPESALGIPALDRARMLLAAGLIGEARDYCDGAIATFTANRAMTDLADALLVGADIAVMADDPARARSLARTAARISGRRGSVSAALLAQLAEHRAAAVLRRSQSGWPAPPTASGRRRATAEASAAAALAGRLAESGLAQDATAAELLVAEALLDAQQVEQAARRWERVDARRAPLGTRLQARLVGARIEMARGRRRIGLTLLRRGLDDLASFQALFGSQDLQAAAAVWGRQLSREGLRAAVRTGSPGAILHWLERARASTTRLPHVRPPADPELAADLGSLRVAQDAARAAVLAGRPDPERDREVAEIRRRIRARSWTLGGTGAAVRPPSIATVQRALTERGGTVLAYFYGAGGVHLLRITPTGASYRPLAGLEEFEELTRRSAADLDLLSTNRVPEPLRRVAGRSLTATLDRMSALIVEPVLAGGGDGPVLVSGTGPFGAVPWALLPGLAGRAVSATHSVTAGLAGLRDRPPASSGGVLAVAGPELSRAADEVGAVAGHYDGAVALAGDAATGRAVLDRMPGGGLLHIAAHGHHESENPLFSSVLLADGPLFAYDIAPVPALPDQIVLSSCDVGRTGSRADGEPLGLAVALLRSGVRTVVAAVAPVSDEAAAAVMDAYHARLAAGVGPAQALAESLPQAGDRPAPFTCFGAGE
jgi:tetratricopeptide (TPR) repeat protein